MDKLGIILLQKEILRKNPDIIYAGTPGNRTQQTALRRLNGVEDRGGHQPRNHPQYWRVVSGNL